MSLQCSRERTDFSLCRANSIAEPSPARLDFATAGAVAGALLPLVKTTGQRPAGGLSGRSLRPLPGSGSRGTSCHSLRLGTSRDGYRRLAWMMVDADVSYLSPSS